MATELPGQLHSQTEFGNEGRAPRSLALIVLFAIVCGFVASSSLLHAAEYKPATRGQPERKFVVKPGGLLIFDADLAHGKVETGDFESVRVSFESYYKVDTAEEVEALYDKLSIEMSQTDNTVRVTVRFADENQANRDKVRLNFKVAIPRKFNLDMRTGGGARLGDIDGTVKVSTGDALTIENIDGSLNAACKGGSLTVRNVTGDVEARCEGGSITIGQVGGRVTASGDGGSVSIKEVATAIDATVNAGSVTAYLSKSPRSDCKITANGGGIDLRLVDSATVTVDAACTNGSVMSDFKIAAQKGSTNSNQLKGDLNGGGPLLLLRASKGSIHLNK